MTKLKFYDTVKEVDWVGAMKDITYHSGSLFDMPH